MLVEDRKYRFLELMSAVSMLPSVDMEDNELAEGSEEWVFPNLTKDIADGDLRDAILCQALREDIEFKFKLVACLTNSVRVSVRSKMDNDTKPSEDDLEALAISANVLWAEGQVTALYGLLGMLGSLVAQFDLKMPELATAFLRGNKGIEGFGKLDPLAIINGDVGLHDIDLLTQED